LGKCERCVGGGKQGDEEMKMKVIINNFNLNL
jgi:hypothetical protein